MKALIRCLSLYTVLGAGAALAQTPPALPPLQPLPALQAGPTLQRGCDWVLVFDPTQPGLGNTAYPDTATRYWVAVVSPTVPAGSRIRVEGRYPDARYAALHVHDGNLGTLDALADYELQPNPGSANRWLDQTRLDPGTTYGGRYTAFVQLNVARPAQRERNTLYRTPPGLLDSDQQKRTALVYRTYLARANNSGRVGLPRLFLDTPGGTVPLQSPEDQAACDEITVALRQDGARLGPASAVVDPLPAAAKPQFKQYRGLLGAEALGTGVAYNQHNGFVFTKTRKDLGQVLLIRGRAPSHSEDPLAPNPPQVRYWSICHAGFNSQKVYTCLADKQTALDASGYYTAVLTDDAVRPPLLNAVPGYSWMPWGSEVPTVETVRELLASPSFMESTVTNPGSGTLAAHKGEYLPKATYCSNAVFASVVALGPAEAFARCAASRL